MKRIFFLVLTNLAIMLLLGLVLNVLLPVLGLSVGRELSGGLLVMALVFGMGGSVVSLLMSKWIAKRSTGAEVIDQPKNDTEKWLLNTVARQAQAAGIAMPEVALYESADINAFATGPNRNKSLVAVSTGLLRAMNRDEAEAVLAHEVSHVANGDMVTLTLIQGVLNTFVIVLARVVGGVVDSMLSGKRDEEEGASSGGGMGYFLIVMVLEMLLGVLASMVVMWFSRLREFRADAGGAQLAGRDKMISALEKLRRASQPSQLPQEVAAFGLRGGKSLFASHPPLEDRIAALRSLR
ncbi:MAG: protease HtpX [Magnetococcus sp. WYHC-3]